MYNTFLSRVLDVVQLNMELETPDDVEKLVIDLLTQLIRLSVYIHKLGRVRRRRFSYRIDPKPNYEAPRRLA